MQSNFAPIESMEELDAFSKQYLMDTYQLDIPICPTLFLMKCAKHIKGSTPTKGIEIPINNRWKLRVLPLTTRWNSPKHYHKPDQGSVSIFTNLFFVLK